MIGFDIWGARIGLALCEQHLALAAEWAGMLGDRLPTPADLPRLTYTEHVIQDAMRVYPPVYLIGREPLSFEAVLREQVTR